MTRRERIRARLIYRRWALYSQMRWFPPYGWITKTAALSTYVRQGRFSSAFGLPYGGQQIPRDPDSDIYADFAKSIVPVTMGVDMGKPGGDVTTIAWRDGHKVHIHEVKFTPEFVERMTQIWRERFERIFFGNLNK